MILALDDFYILVGLLFAVTAIMNLRDRSNPRCFTSALFWGLYALLYLAGSRMPSAATGLLMVAMALVAPMAEAAAEARYREKNRTLDEAKRQRIRAMSAATDNVGLFFGEDVFVAFGAIVLMQTILRAEGLEVDPLHMALWGIPTAVTAFVIHAWNLRRLDARIMGGAAAGGPR